MIGEEDMKIACKKFSMLALCMVMSLAIALAVPKGNGKAKGHEKHHNEEDQAEAANTSVAVSIFMAGDRDLIRNHYRGGDRRGLPPGLAKRGGDLPPGLQKQLIRKGHLPPGLEKKLYPFPVELERRLPPLRPHLIRGIIGGSAVIYDKNTRVILDIFAVL